MARAIRYKSLVPQLPIQQVNSPRHILELANAFSLFGERWLNLIILNITALTVTLVNFPFTSLILYVLFLLSQEMMISVHLANLKV